MSNPLSALLGIISAAALVVAVMLGWERHRRSLDQWIDKERASR